MKKILLLLAICSATFCTAQSPLDDYITDQMASKHISGLSAVLIKNGKLAWKGHYGLANRAENQPVTDSTIFMIASVSKTITANALLHLWQENGFDLDADINDFLPFEVRNPNFPDDIITTRQLLTHTSSIKDNWNELPYFEGDSPISLADFLFDYLSPQGANYHANLNFYSYAPQTHYNYCNVSAALCGYLVEVISGTPFNEYCNTHLFEPLCMDNTGWFLSELNTDLVAHPYSYSGGDYQDEGLYGYPDYPDGQLRTTALSLAKFLWMNMNHGLFDGTQVMDSTTIADMRTIQFPAIADDQGLIWYYYTDAMGTWWGHNGGDAGVSTDMYFNEATQTGLVLLTNGDGNHTPIWNKILQAADTMTIENAPDIACLIETPVAINDIPTSSFSLYPNPAGDILHLATPALSGTLEIVDMTGKKIRDHAFNNTSRVSLDIADLAAGVYFINWVAENNSGILRFIKS
jgi:CubicO group peptidase (beta-lactamase class C family)